MPSRATSLTFAELILHQMLLNVPLWHSVYYNLTHSKLSLQQLYLWVKSPNTETLTSKLYAFVGKQHLFTDLFPHIYHKPWQHLVEIVLSRASSCQTTNKLANKKSYIWMHLDWAYYTRVIGIITVTSACFSWPALFGGTELFSLLEVAFDAVCGDITVSKHHAVHSHTIQNVINNSFTASTYLMHNFARQKTIGI